MKNIDENPVKELLIPSHFIFQRHILPALQIFAAGGISLYVLLYGGSSIRHFF